MNEISLRFFIVILVLGLVNTAHAWGRRGHSIVCETAAYLASSQESGEKEIPFLKIHSFDLGYQCNVPDIVWKRPATYDLERPNHYMNSEAFEKAIGEKERGSAFQLSREDFEKKYKNLPESNGRSWWRIQEINSELLNLSKKLQSKEVTKKQGHEWQAQWLVLAGVLGHYVGDLAMPLHVSENYDGQLTNQKGLHHFFEESMVDALYLQRNLGLQSLVYQEALKLWPKFVKDNQDKNALQLAQELSKDSQKAVPKLLELDKKWGRKNLEGVAKNYQALVVQRLILGSLYQGLFLLKARNQVSFNDDRFFDFIESPAFIKPLKKAN